ncbi:uncharacterized protein LOC111780056 [Cucurbita pepo subsp. pepo]|uniref:uncharacterized protein LOC111780056 n=1 Tax=Cucurbita pepo subsp. pepo TaxID=3664 RepID=UPI000C9D3602|nr:uncharacterized protein LOC111780056 [Cucurbita pepo subsp. pepo]
MLDGILGRGFTSKCKSQIKLTKSRIDVIRRKKKATLKFLKKDIADLLANGLDINAYGRAEGLLVELTISSCYDFVEQSCDTVLKHLPIMQKQRECPEECCEAIASLMFAAARFSDLPELRELRQIFQERFGTSVEHLENRKFVENLASKPSTLEKKVQLLQDIALEFSIKWDSVGFEKRMSTPPAYAQGLPKDFGAHNAAIEKSPSHAKAIDPRVKDGGVSYREKFEEANARHRFLNPSDSTIVGGKELKFQPKQEFPRHRHENRVYDEEETILKSDGRINLYGEKKGHEARIGRMGSSSSSEVQKDADNELVVQNGRERRVPDYLKSSPYNNPGLAPTSKHEAGNGMMSSAFGPRRMGSSSSSEVLGDVDDGRVVHNSRERTVPNYLKSPPYSNPGLAPSNIKEPSSGNTHTGHGYAVHQGKAEEDKHQNTKPSFNSILPPPYVKANSRRKDNKDRSHDNNCVKSEMTTGVELEPRHSDHERQVISPLRASSHGGEMDHFFGGRIPPDALPKPRSVRRRHHKPRSSHSVDDNAEDIRTVRKKSRSSSRRRDDKRGLQLLIDEQENERDEEERIIDKLLIHYSKKPSTFEPGKIRRKPKNHLSLGNGTDSAKSPLNLRSRDEADKQADTVHPPARSASLPPEHHLGPSETTKVYTRAISFQPDRSSAAKHVHPKLPDYDDLAARFAALRGR